MNNGGIGARKGMGLGEMGRTEHAKENKAIRFVAGKMEKMGNRGKRALGTPTKGRQLDRWE